MLKQIGGGYRWPIPPFAIGSEMMLDMGTTISIPFGITDMERPCKQLADMIRYNNQHLQEGKGLQMGATRQFGFLFATVGLDHI